MVNLIQDLIRSKAVSFLRRFRFAAIDKARVYARAEIATHGESIYTAVWCAAIVVVLLVAALVHLAYVFVSVCLTPSGMTVFAVAAGVLYYLHQQKYGMTVLLSTAASFTEDVIDKVDGKAMDMLRTTRLMNAKDLLAMEFEAKQLQKTVLIREAYFAEKQYDGFAFVESS